MRGTSNNQTCYDCEKCVERDGITHGVCKVKNEPVGGLDWTSDMFDKNPRHIFPDFAEICRDFVPQKEVTE
jgi:hypothetical protein